MQLLVAALRPDLGPEQTQANLRQPVVQMSQHDVVTPINDGRVKGNGPGFAGVRMGQPFGAQRPASFEGWQVKNGAGFALAAGIRPYAFHLGFP